MTEIVQEELPDWLIELRDQQLREQSQAQEQPIFAEEPQEQIDQASLVGDLRSQMAYAEEQMAQVEEQAPQAEEVEEEEPPSDMLDSLREQIILADEEFEEEQKASFAQTLLDLKPAQRLLLAVLLFLNVAVCGCMGLVMFGRVVLPF